MSDTPKNQEEEHGPAKTDRRKFLVAGAGSRSAARASQTRCKYSRMWKRPRGLTNDQTQRLCLGRRGRGSSTHRTRAPARSFAPIELPSTLDWRARGDLAHDPPATSADRAHSSSASTASGADSPFSFRNLPLLHRVVDESRFHSPARPSAECTNLPTGSGAESTRLPFSHCASPLN